MTILGIAQIDSTLGNIEKNINKHIDFINESIIKKVDFLVFPELSLSGYLVQDSVSFLALTQEELLQKFAKINHEITVTIGYVENDNRGKIYNSSATISFSKSGAKIINNTRKINLPTYGMFDEARHFNAGCSSETFLAKNNFFISTIICEDFWHPVIPITTALSKSGAPDFFLVPAASPSRGYRANVPSNILGWEKNISFYATSFGSYVLNAQKVGVEDSFIFVGGSMIAMPDGTILKAPLFEESLLIKEFDKRDLLAKRQKTTIVSLADLEILKNNLK